MKSFSVFFVIAGCSSLLRRSGHRSVPFVYAHQSWCLFLFIQLLLELLNCIPVEFAQLQVSGLGRHHGQLARTAQVPRWRRIRSTFFLQDRLKLLRCGIFLPVSSRVIGQRSEPSILFRCQVDNLLVLPLRSLSSIGEHVVLICMQVSKQVLVRLDRLLTFPGLSARLLTFLSLASS